MSAHVLGVRTGPGVLQEVCVQAVELDVRHISLSALLGRPVALLGQSRATRRRQALSVRALYDRAAERPALHLNQRPRVSARDVLCSRRTFRGAGPRR